VGRKREGLVAEQRVDRNGNTVTRWVKPAVSAVAVSVPAPSVAAPEKPKVDRIALYRDLASDVLVAREGGTERTLQLLGETLYSYPERVVEKLADPVLREDEDMWDRIKSTVQQGDSADAVSEYIYFLPYVHHTSSAVMSRWLVASLHSYSQLPDTADYSGESEQVRGQCVALIRFANAAVMQQRKIFRNDDRFAIDDPALVELIMKHSDNVDTMITAMTERGSADPEVLRPIMESRAQALHHGVL
jgi:hypothetical protein